MLKYLLIIGKGILIFPDRNYSMFLGQIVWHGEITFVFVLVSIILRAIVNAHGGFIAVISIWFRMFSVDCLHEGSNLDTTEVDEGLTEIFVVFWQVFVLLHSVIGADSIAIIIVLIFTFVILVHSRAGLDTLEVEGFLVSEFLIVLREVFVLLHVVVWANGVWVQIIRISTFVRFAHVSIKLDGLSG